MDINATAQSTIETNKNVINIDPNAATLENIHISPQVTDDNYSLSINSS